MPNGTLHQLNVYTHNSVYIVHPVCMQTFNHEGIDNVVVYQLKVIMSNPVYTL